MKLYASSFRIGSDRDAFRALFPPHPRVAVIRNSLDFSDDIERLEAGRRREFDDLQSLGFTPEDFDLRDYFSSTSTLATAIKRYDGVWVVGGNAFILRRAMNQSGFDSCLWSIATHGDDFVYAGYSAGSCVLSPTLRGIDLVDPPNVVPSGYAMEPTWEGLGLLEYSIAPHYRSDHPESEAIETVVAYFEQHGIPYRALRDGEAIISST